MINVKHLGAWTYATYSVVLGLIIAASVGKDLGTYLTARRRPGPDPPSTKCAQRVGGWGSGVCVGGWWGGGSLSEEGGGGVHARVRLPLTSLPPFHPPTLTHLPCRAGDVQPAKSIGMVHTPTNGSSGVPAYA